MKRRKGLIGLVWRARRDLNHSTRPLRGPFDKLTVASLPSHSLVAFGPLLRASRVSRASGSESRDPPECLARPEGIEPPAYWFERSSGRTIHPHLSILVAKTAYSSLS